MPRAPKEKYTAEHMRSLFSYEQNTGKLFWLDDQRRGRVKAGAEAGSKRQDGYVRIQYKGERFLAHRVAWVVHYGAWPSKFLDHINRDRSDNRIENLRIATHAENTRNAPARSHNKSGLKGVQARRGVFRARITVDGMRINLGQFPTPEEAHSAYLAAAEKLHGAFASA